MVAAAKLQAQKAANDFKDFSECRMTGKYSTMVKNNEYASAGLAPAMSVDGKVTTEKVSFVMEKMDKKEREALLGKAPKFMSYENMKGMAVKAAVAMTEKALDQVGEELGDLAKQAKELTDGAAEGVVAIAESGVGDMVGEQLAAAGEAVGEGIAAKVDAAVDEAVDKAVDKATGAVHAQVDHAVEQVMDKGEYYKNKIAALDKRKPPPFDPKKEGCIKVMDKGTKEVCARTKYPHATCMPHMHTHARCHMHVHVLVRMAGALSGSRRPFPH